VSEAPQVVWTPRARLRLAEILRVIRDDAGHEASAKWGQKLLHSPDILADHPYIGQMVPDLGRNEIREIGIAPYRIIYRVSRRGCIVVSVRHNRQLVTRKNLEQ
jgi:plasmid stabilization system protein ParE